MRYAHAQTIRDADGPQFFAIPAAATSDPAAWRDMWLWWGDDMVPVERGAFVPQDDGRLVFEPNND